MSATPDFAAGFRALAEARRQLGVLPSSDGITLRRIEETHPLYRDDALVGRVTRQHLADGMSMLQLWITKPHERQHAAWVLDQLAPCHKASVLSLGSGVAGMEAVWSRLRPDMRFTLVNKSLAQLSMSLCPGARVWANAMAYRLPDDLGHDVIVMAYMLGHVDAPRLLDQAVRMLAPGGVALVLDVFDTEPDFKPLMHYDAPRAADMQAAGFVRVPVEAWHLHGPVADMQPFTRSVVERSKPAMWVHRA